MKRLCIDPGHGQDNRKPGSYDPGAVCASFCEADIALQWALTLKWVCLRNGIEVFMTRDDDRDSAPLGQRDEKAERAGCTHYLSLHCNSGGGHGTEVFYRDQRDKEFGAKVLSAALKADLDPPSDRKAPKAPIHNRGLKAESQSQHPRLSVFDFDGPAALLEIGFIDEPGDRHRMLQREARLKFAEALVKELLSA